MTAYFENVHVPKVDDLPLAMWQSSLTHVGAGYSTRASNSHESFFHQLDSWASAWEAERDITQVFGATSAFNGKHRRLSGDVHHTPVGRW